MFQEKTIQKLEFFITHYPLSSSFPKIDIETWGLDSFLGLEYFLIKETDGKYDHKLGRRCATPENLEMQLNLKRFSKEWELLFDASLLRYFA